MSLKKRLLLVAVIVVSLVFLISGFCLLMVPEQDTLYQVSMFSTLAAGNYNGNITFAELAKHGDFGMGTLNGLNGEMFALNGKFYQIPVDGAPREIDFSEKTPYATVTFFSCDQTLSIADGSNYSQLVTSINSSLPKYDTIYAIKISGYFDFVKTRSVPIQTEPYPTLTEALKNQTEFSLSNVKGTMVGFFFPNSMNGVDAVGYHLHFLTDDCTAGGHVLECIVRNVTVELDQTNNYYLVISS